MGDDFELLERWCAGQRDAGNELLERHFQSLYRFFSNKVQDDLDELVQATMLACVRSVGQFRRQSSFKTYLFGIARNQLYTYFRQRERDRKHLDFGVTSLADMGITPGERIHRGRRQALLLDALRKLPVEQQVLLELYYWEEMSVGELSELFDIAETATRARLTRARRSLRRHYDELTDGESRADDLDAQVRSLHDESMA